MYSAGVTWTRWCYSGEVVKKCWLLQYTLGVIVFPNSLSFCNGWGSLCCADVRTRDHEGIRISMTITNANITQPLTSTSPSSGSSRRHQPAIPEVASTQTCGSPFWASLLSWLTGTSGVFKDHFSWLRLVAAHFISQCGVAVSFSQCFQYVLSFCHWMGQAFYQQGHESKVVINQIFSLLPLLRQVFIQFSILHRLPLRHGMQQAHHFLAAKLFLRQVVGCLASVDRSWWGQCCCFSYDLQALRTVKSWMDFMQLWL